MEYRFAIDSRKCMNHDQPLRRLYPDLIRHFRIKEQENGYITFVDIHNLKELNKLKEEVGYPLKLRDADNTSELMLCSKISGNLFGILEIVDDE